MKDHTIWLLKNISLIILFLIPAYLSAQPANDACNTAILLDDVANYCSDDGAFNNTNANNNPILPIFDCPTENNADVWFKFVANAPNVTITVTGQTGGVFPGGTLRNPEVQLMFATNGNCSDFQSIECSSDDSNSHFVSINKGGLIPGTEYLIRVQGRNNRTGTFRLCVNNYTPAFPPESDCTTSHLLCDKSSFFVENFEGAGDDPNEAAGSCLDIDPFSTSESSSTWYKWIAANDGTLTFTLTPENPEDDLDFAVYELPKGINDCDDKTLLRCIASGANRGEPFSQWQRCVGPTGLRLGDTDLEEQAGCQSGDNNFVAALEMEEGKAYALLVNIFSSTGKGFTIDFGGTGMFLGPQPDVELIINKSNNIICVGEEAGFSGEASSFLLGEITEYQWSFGAGAEPSTATGIGPHDVLYQTPGDKTVILTLTTNLGCVISEIEESIVLVEPCCETVNGITGDGIVENVLCGDSKGSVDLTVQSASLITSFEWNNNERTEDLSNLSQGEYIVTVTNLATCEQVFTFPVDSVAPFKIEPIITKPTCNGGRDGAINLNIIDGFEPMQIDFGNGFGNSRTLTDLVVGDYPVTVIDGNGCSENSIIEVRELVLELDSSVAAIKAPSCFGFRDGEIELNFVNGLEPYSYNWNDGNGFTGNNLLTNIEAGSYPVNVVDQNLCKGNFVFIVEDPPALNLILDTLDVSCAGLNDGMLAAFVEGGTGSYRYQWNNNQQTDEISNLSPGTYSLTVLDDNECEIQGEGLIIEPLSINIEVTDIQDVVCFGDQTGFIQVMGSGGNPTYQYSIDGISFQNEAIINNLAAGSYTISIQDQRGCTETVDAIINQPEQLVVDAGPDVTIDLGYTGQLEATARPIFRPVTFSWSNSDYLSCSDCPNPVASPPTNTTFLVTITDESNCVAMDSVRLLILPNRPLYIPTAFSPNLDGRNDNFTIYGGPAALRINELSIYDRWGNLLYTTSNISLNEENLGWDGRSNGKDLPTGVYAFIAEIAFIDEVVQTISGDITLVR